MNFDKQDMGVQNVLVFMSDALRWDYTPKWLLREGASFKTVSAGTLTFLSLPSMITGVYPQRHGVFSWRHIIPQTLISLFDLEGYDIGFYNAAGVKDGVNSILRKGEQRALKDLAPPFIYFERDHGGHSPYHGAGYTGSHQEFLKEFSGSTERIRSKYSEAVKESVLRFENRLEVLDREGLLDETLVVFTSDHGELLGEYGLVGHGSPLCPELVYVPTVFIHPTLPRGINVSIMRHVDLFPTILTALDMEIPEQCEGESVFLESVEVGCTYAVADFHWRNYMVQIYAALGIWDSRGGHIFNQTTALKKIIICLRLLIGPDWKSRYLRRHLFYLPKAIKRYISTYTEFGEPDIIQEDSLRYMKRMQGTGVVEAETTTLGEEVEQRLRDLGYLD